MVNLSEKTDILCFPVKKCVKLLKKTDIIDRLLTLGT